jgi:hypothetical protein
VFAPNSKHRALVTPAKRGGAVKVIACIEDPVVIKRILDHLKQEASANAPSPLTNRPILGSFDPPEQLHIDQRPTDCFGHQPNRRAFEYAPQFHRVGSSREVARRRSLN